MQYFNHYIPLSSELISSSFNSTMAKYLIALALLAALAGASQIHPLGVVEGINDCGSAGKLGPVHVTDCDAVPCALVPGTVYDIQIYFTASKTSDALNLYVYRIINNSELIFLFLVPINGEIEAGLEYVLDFDLPVTAELPGRSDIRFAILNADPVYTEICAEASVFIRV